MKRIRRLLADPGPARHSAAPPIAAGLWLVAFAVAVTAWPATPSAALRVPAVALQARLLEAQLLEPQMSRLTESLQTDPGQTPPGQTVETQAGTDAKRQAEEDALLRQIGTPYQKWLTEDVVYIISAEERSAFLRLRNNEEREQFIEQFWNRRNPTPGTQENKFKEEHYRRIAYTNEHFGTTALAGWRTDRGRTYVVYGPPDEIEDHPAGGQNVAPYQRWTYRLIDGIGEHVTFVFSDRDRNGQFRLVEERAGERQANANSNAAQLKALQSQLTAANQRLSQLRQQYQDANPEVQAARERLAQLKAEVAAAETVASGEAQKESFQAKKAQARQAQALAHAQAQTGAAELTRNRAAVEADLQAAIGVAKERLANLQQSYTEKYPEVRAEQQNLKRLQEQLAFLNRNGAKALVKAPAPSVTAAKIFRSDQDPRVQVATGAQSASGSVTGLSALIVALSPDKRTSSITAEITSAAGQKVQTVAVAEQVQAPGPFFRWVVLPPGSYVLKATIEGPKGVSKSSQTRFTVE
jgi:GWxTD domain-containing protein